MREDEEGSKNAIHAFLRLRYNDSDIIWLPGNRNVPPDYYLQLSGIKYAVEVTNLMESVNIGGKTTSHLGFRNSVNEVLKAIEQEARQEGVLNGAYVVRYKPLDNLAKLKTSICRSIKEYMRDTQSMSSAEKKDILGRGHLRWYIWKIHSQDNFLTGVTGDAKWEGEAVDELRALLQRTIEEKVRKLQNISYPKILIIIDRYPWLERTDWSGCLSNLNLINKFHTVFLVSHDRGNSILHSVESRWLKLS